jgi:hypothetical protein
MDSTSLDTVLSLMFRHAMTVACGALITSGYVPNSITKEQMIGAGMGAGAIALSWWNKRGYGLAMGHLKQFEDKVGIKGIAAHYAAPDAAAQQPPAK